MWTVRRGAAIHTLIGVLVCFALLAFVRPDLTFAAGQQSAEAAAQHHEEVQKLEAEKLRERVQKLKRENAPGDLGDDVLKYAPLVTALIALLGVVLTVWKLLVQRSTEIKQRDSEAKRRVEDQFAANLAQLGADGTAEKAGAAASIVTYLAPSYKSFHHQVRVAVLTNLKLPQEEPVRKLLARVYVEAMHSDQEIDQFERDLSNAKLGNTDLRDLELKEADLAFADLHNSDLAGCNLFRARGHSVNLGRARICADGGDPPSLIEVRFKDAKCRKADFSGAILVNAHMKGADLRRATFYGCHLQAAHFEGADLTEARFHQADLADTHFTGATLDRVCKKSISRALRWRKAHFDPGVKAEIEALSEQ
jgi:uncharacterized protein YjbI with pentapeptide repeats